MSQRIDPDSMFPRSEWDRVFYVFGPDWPGARTFDTQHEAERLAKHSGGHVETRYKRRSES